MHPNLSLTTSFPPHHPSTSPSQLNRLPTSSTTSPASSSPSASVSARASSPFSFTSFRPNFHFNSNPHRGASPSSSGSGSASIASGGSGNRSRSTSPLRLSTLFLRRRPSKIDLALSAERTRCDADAIERQGLSLMEPRPVDPVDGSIFASLEGHWRARESLQSQSLNQGLSGIHPCDSQRGFVRPRFVMGGIFEVMEGRD